MGRSQLEGVRRCRRGSNGNTKSKGKTASEEVGIGLGGRLDNGTHHDEQRTGHHTRATAKLVANETGEERADHVTDGVNHEDAIKRAV